MKTTNHAPPLKLFDYQKKLIHDIYNEFRAGNSKVCAVAPTGAGKTVVMAQICEHGVNAGRRILILVHLDILVPQTADKLHAFGLKSDIGYIKANYPENPDALVQIASIQTLGRRRWWRELPVNLVIYDEAHITLFSQIGQKIRYETHGDSKVIALTATPYRLKKTEGMADHLESLVSAPIPRELQAMGRLSQMKYFGIGAPDLSNVRTTGGDFNEADLAVACERPELISKIVSEYQRLTPDKRAIAFCVGVSHAHAVADAFNQAGIEAATVTGETPIRERAVMYDNLANGSLRLLTSVNVVSIGFDVPNVEVGLLLRPTKSLALHHQQIGRVMRVAEGKDCGIILDQAGNCKRHGFPEDVDEYTLRPSKKAEAGEAPIKECPECSALLPTFAVVCPHCGYEFPIPEKVTETGELVELIPESKVRGKSERDYRKMLQTAFRNGYDPKWAWHRFREKYGYAPLRGWEYGAIFGDDATENIANYYFYLVEIADRLSRDKAWIIDRLSREFGRDNAYAFAVCLQGETLQINATEVNEYA